jgi:hypothetical protein
MAAILAQVFSPPTRTQCQNMGNKIDSNATASESGDDHIFGAKKFEGQSECDYGEDDSLFPDFFDKYFCFMLNLTCI